METVEIDSTSKERRIIHSQFEADQVHAESLSKSDYSQHLLSFCIRVPGKSLLTGGYLILDEPNRGLSVSVTAHTLAKVQAQRTESGIEVAVYSPNLGQKWTYHVHPNSHIIESLGNPFLEESIRSVLSYCGTLSYGWHIYITLTNEGGFYFTNNGKQTKTGFGSSSTTVIATISSLLLCFHAISWSLLEQDRQLIAKLSMEAHQRAQGGIGSGYDIITGVFGSCIYQKDLSSSLRCNFTHFKCPESFIVVFGYGGSKSSSTPVLVKKVKEWRKNSSVEEKQLWNEYSQNNEAIIEMITGEKDRTILKGLYQSKLEIVRKIGVVSGSNIVPDEVYALMKRTNEVNWVIGCMIAGAGGADSFYCLCDRENWKAEEIESIWANWDYHISPVQIWDKGLTLV